MRWLALLSLALVMTFDPAALQARELSAAGFGASQAVAREEALSALASTIFVHIESTSELYQSDQGENYFISNTLSTTQLPLIGVETDCTLKSGAYNCRARLRTGRVLPLYRQALDNAAREIRDQIRQAESSEGLARYQALGQALAAYDQLDKYRLVIAYLSETPVALPDLTLSAGELRASLARQRERASSIGVAVAALLDDFDESGIAPQAPLPEDSREVTPFGRAVLSELERQMGARLDTLTPRFQLVGRYRQDSEGLELSYSLIDDEGNSHRTSLVRLVPAAYADYPTQPSMIEFERLLHSGYAVSDDFQVQISSNRGSRGLSFEAGSTVVLMARLSRPGYFYVVGHTHGDGGEKSYLLDLQDAPGARRFVAYVNADQANRWLSLGEFVVQAPFGTESLQLVAAENDLVEQLPNHYYDQSSGYYIVARTLEEGVEQVRLRSLQRRRETGGESAEAVLMFNTSESRP